MESSSPTSRTPQTQKCPICSWEPATEVFYVRIIVRGNTLMPNGQIFLTSLCCQSCFQKVVRRSKTNLVVWTLGVCVFLAGLGIRALVFQDIPWGMAVIPAAMLAAGIVWAARETLGVNLKLSDRELVSQAKMLARREFSNATPTIEMVTFLPDGVRAIEVDSRRIVDAE
jgi:hypothetical protein